MASAILKLGLLSKAGMMFLPTSTGRLSSHLIRRTVTSNAAAESDTKEVTDAAPQQPRRDALYQRIEVEVRGHDPAVLKSYEWYACQAAEHLGIQLSKKWVPPKHLLRRDTLKSVHIYRKHMVQYEARTHFRIMEFKHLTESTADTYLEYIQRNLPEGVAMVVTKHELQKIPSHIGQRQTKLTPGEAT